MEWVIALFVGGILCAAIYERLQKPKRLKAAQERDEQRRTRARLNGWNFEVEREPGALIYRYSGVTDGITWTFETSSWTSRSRGNQRAQNTTRWWTSDVFAPNAILAIWPSFGEADRIGTQVPQFVMNLILTPLIRSLRADSDDAALLSQAAPVASDDPRISRHFLLRATDPGSMQRFLADGAREVLAEAGPWLASRSQSSHLVIAAFTKSGFTMLVSNFVDDPELVGKIVKTGAALANAYRK
jgi:hypothetical protein